MSRVGVWIVGARAQIFGVVCRWPNSDPVLFLEAAPAAKQAAPAAKQAAPAAKEAAGRVPAARCGASRRVLLSPGAMREGGASRRASKRRAPAAAFGESVPATDADLSSAPRCSSLTMWKQRSKLCERRSKVSSSERLYASVTQGLRLSNRKKRTRCNRIKRT